MSLIDYELLLEHLHNPNARPGVGHIDADGFASWWAGRSLETYKYNRGEQPYVFQTLAKKAALLLGMAKGCLECSGEGAVYGTDAGPSSVPCLACQSRGYTTDSEVPFLDRLALFDIGPVPNKCSVCEGRGGETFDTYDPETGVHDYDVISCASCKDTGEVYVLPADKCKLCRGVKYRYECPKCEGDGKFIRHKWFPQKDCTIPIGSLCPHPDGDTADKCTWCVHEKFMPGQGQPGLRSSPDRGRAWDYPMGKHPAADDDEAWHRVLVREVIPRPDAYGHRHDLELKSRRVCIVYRVGNEPLEGNLRRDRVLQARNAVRESTERAPVTFHMGAPQ